MPNKTIYVSDGDLSIYQRAQDLAGGNLSAAISSALRRYVDVEEGRREGYDEIVVDQIMEAIAKDGYRMQTLVSKIVTSYPFVNRRIHEPEVLTSNGQ